MLLYYWSFTRLTHLLLLLLLTVKIKIFYLKIIYTNIRTSTQLFLIWCILLSYCKLVVHSNKWNLVDWIKFARSSLSFLHQAIGGIMLTWSDIIGDNTTNKGVDIKLSSANKAYCQIFFNHQLFLLTIITTINY